MLLKDRVAIVTGGTKGIGKGISLKFAREGCDVVVNARHIEDAKKIAAEIKSLGRRSLAIAADVSKSAEVNDMVARTVREFGKIDILVNNAGGVSGDSKIEDTTDEAWERVIGVNLTGQFLCCRAVVPHMKKKKYGKIVHYHSAKGGVLGLTTDLAFELAPYNITVNAILPGPIRTEFFTEMLKSMTAAEGKAFFKMLESKVPMHRMGEPEEIAGVALFLASELSSYVTGQAINAGGGLPLEPLDT
jgi:NAD(P)-dependent dehydrogenase (short-subunit alcohol dehydrogenase family)